MSDAANWRRRNGLDLMHSDSGIAALSCRAAGKGQDKPPAEVRAKIVVALAVPSPGADRAASVGLYNGPLALLVAADPWWQPPVESYVDEGHT